MSETVNVSVVDDDNFRVKGLYDELPSNINKSKDYWDAMMKRYYPFKPVVITLKGSDKILLKNNRLMVPPTVLFKELTKSICDKCVGINPKLPLIFSINGSCMNNDESIESIYQLYGLETGFIHVILFQESSEDETVISNENELP